MFVRYEYRVSAANKAGKVYSDWARITTSEGVPDKVEAPQIVHVRGTQVRNLDGIGDIDLPNLDNAENP